MNTITIGIKRVKLKLNEQIFQGTAIPILCSSALMGIGMDELLLYLQELEPLVGDENKEAGSYALVCRITHDKAMGRIAHVRIFEGSLKSRDSVVLDPMQKMKIIVQENLIGKIIGDLVAMRASYNAPIIYDGIAQVEGKVPIATSLDYPIRLSSLTGGRGVLSTRFAGYEPCPMELFPTATRHGVNPLDRDKWILNQRNAL